MGRGGKVSFDDLYALRDRMEGLSKGESDELIERCAMELTRELLAAVSGRTPIGQYPPGSGKTGGTLLRRWTTDNQSLTLRREGDAFLVDVVNNTDYASHVNYGHRTRGGKGWIPGQFMLEISEKEISGRAPSVLQKVIKTYLRDAIG